MRKLFVDRLRVQASVGILDYELLSKQQLLISLAVEMPHAPTLPEADTVHHVLDYRQLRDAAHEEAQAGHINMLETLAGRIAQRLLALPGVALARVRVVKPNVFPDCDGVAVEVEAVREPSPGSRA
ncbi:MAG: dihydroneopterin aldolase [Burkholderiaceae bacterium]